MRPVLLVSGLVGFVTGALVFPSWQVAVETSQVVAGLVHYPPGNPFGLYHVKLWTILHQVCAPLLRLGVSEIVLSKALSGLLGMVSFQSYALVIYALSRNALLAVGATFLLLVSRIVLPGAPYPLDVSDTVDTYGVLGLSTFVLIVGLLGTGSYRLGAFLLGLAPAIHPALGFWLLLAVTACFVWDFTNLRQEWRPGLPYFVAGGLLSASSLVAHLVMMRGVPAIDPEEASRYLSFFVAFWDWHRGPAGFRTLPGALNFGAAALGLIWLFALRKDVPRPAVFVLRLVVVSAFLSFVLVGLSRIPPGMLPRTFLILMPTRLLNINEMMFISLVLGLAGIYRRQTWSRILLGVVLAGLLFSTHGMLRNGLPPRVAMQDRTNDPFFAAIAAGHNGLLLTGGSLHLIQLRTRRPVLLDGGGLDMLPYALEGGPEMGRILHEVYAIDFFNPPEEGFRGGGIPDSANKPAWERFPAERWREIGRAFNVTQVVTAADWQLHLPVTATSHDLRLYRIPE